MIKQIKKLSYAIAFAFLCSLSIAPAFAEPVAGDACSVDGAFIIAAESGQNTRLLICDGSNWKSGQDIANTGQSLFNINDDSASSCTADKLGRLSYDGTSTWEYCDGDSWEPLFGTSIWTDDGSGNIHNTASGKVGIKTGTTAKVPLEVNGTIIFGDTGETCDSTIEGALRYETVGNNYEYCDGSDWIDLNSTINSGDTTPNAFTFTDLTDKFPSSQFESNVVTLSGFDGPLIASISGGTSPAISINGGAWVSSGEVNPGDTIQARFTSTASNSSSSSATIAVGATSDNWSISTIASGTYGFISGVSAAGGSLGGIAGADAICQEEADGLNFGGTWKAVLSTDTVDAKDHLTITYPVRNKYNSATVKASNLWSTTSTSADFTTNTGGAGGFVWTGTDTDGTVYESSTTCDNWATTSYISTRIGYPVQNGSGYWLSYGAGGCVTSSYNILCFSQ